MKGDFKNGKIYKITNDYNDAVYIGSTCETLIKRYSIHKSSTNSEKINHRPLYKLMNEIGFERFRIELICDFPCEDKYQLRQKEGEYIRSFGTLNTKIECRTKKEYKEEHKEITAQQMKDWAKTNEDYILQYHKDYYMNNKDKINEYKSEKIVCDCGCEVKRNHLARHKKSLKHINNT